jgi:AcrR family transcriptional regulator
MTNRREEILDKFTKLVSSYGLGKTSMQDLAREMGISVGTIYNDFTNKEDLILAFWQRVEAQCIAHLDSIAGCDLPPEQLLRLLMLEYIKMLSEQLRTNRGIYDLMMESSISYLGKSILGRRQIIQQALIKRVGEILGKGLESGIFEFPGDADLTAFYFVAAFTEYSAPPLIVSRHQEEVLQEAGSMFDFVIRTVKSH